jgi:integrase
LLYRFVVGDEIGGLRGVSLPGPHYKGPGRGALGLHARRKRRHLVLRVKTPQTIVEPLTREQVVAFLRSLRRYRDLAIVYLMLFCGLRSQEVLSLRTSDVNVFDRRLRVHGKGNRERMLPLPAELSQVLTDYIRLERPSDALNEPLFVVLQGRRRGRPMTAAGLRSLFRYRRDRSSGTLANANAHRFRHTFAADMARSGVRLPVLQRMMGHADAKMTLQYIHLSMADIAAEYQRAIEVITTRYEQD